MHHLLTNGVGDCFQFKNALIKMFGRTLEQVQEELSFASGLGDKMPSELLAHLRQVLGRHLKENPSLEHTLKREFLTRLSTYARDPLIIMSNADLDKMAEQADALVADRKRRTFVVRHSIPVFQLPILPLTIPIIQLHLWPYAQFIANVY